MSDRSEIEEYARQLCHAEVSHDRAAFERLYADDFALIHSTGQTDGKAAIIDFLLAINFTHSESVSLDLEVWGDTALRTCSATSKISEKPGERPVVVKLLFTQVWRKNKIGWQVRLVHTSFISREPETQDAKESLA